jgi:excinuclease UvrABC nuclease subunit
VFSVYVAYDVDDVVLYVGRTSKGERRVRQHGKASTWWPRVYRIAVTHYESAEICAIREYEAIRMLRPEFNVDLPTTLVCPAEWDDLARLSFRSRYPLVTLR